MRYSIYEENMTRLEKKLTRIQNKCNKYGCSFHYSVVGEEFKQDMDGNTYRYLVVEAEGIAVQSDWEFVATLDFLPSGTVIRKFKHDITIPERYYHTEPICEHCGTRRRRKNVYLVHNTVTDEFKQVGASCLCDFTHGLSAEAVTSYISLYDELIKGETPYEGSSYTRHYYNTEEYLAYVYECVKRFGYSKTEAGADSTKQTAFNYLQAAHGNYFPHKEQERLLHEMSVYDIDITRKEVTDTVKAALIWISSQQVTTDYIHNLKAICSEQYTTSKNLGFMVSLIPSYLKEVEREQELQRKKASELNSTHVGCVGDRIKFQCTSVSTLTAWDTIYGTTFLYKLLDDAGNTYTWKTSKYIPDTYTGLITATVKAHNEFRGVKQTELTRAKLS